MDSLGFEDSEGFDLPFALLGHSIVEWPFFLTLAGS